MAMTAPPAGALSGVRILDLSWGVAGPLGVLLLAEQGADVVKVERPGGDPFREYPGSRVWNRSRRSVAIDLKQSDGRDVLLDLCAGADVIVESFSPGTMERLGLGYGELSERFPELVYCSVPAYPAGHHLAGRPGYDALVQARSGLQQEQPGWREGPVFLQLAAPSMAACFLVATGVLAALFARKETGRGQHVETSLYQGVLAFTTAMWQELERTDSFTHLMMGKSYPPGIHQVSVFECAEGEWVHAATMNGLTPTRTQEDILGVEPLDVAAAAMLTPEERARIAALTRDAFRRWKRDELVEAFHAARLGAEAVVPMADAFSHPQLVANAMAVTVTDPELGPTTQVGVPVVLSATPGGITGPRPACGEHTRELLAGHGYDELRIEDLIARGVVEAGASVTGEAHTARPVAAWAVPRAVRPHPHQPEAGTPRGGSQRGGPLAGIVVLDLGQALAGPFGPMVLADLGAEVIKVEPVTGDMMRFATKPFVGCQRGKKDIAVDLKTPEGREIIHGLVARADVVHHNMTQGVAERLGVDYPTVRSINPQAVYCNTWAYGANGPLAAFGGLDPLYQAACGIEYEAGPVHEGNPPLYLRLGVCDTANAFLSVVGVLCALLHRQSTGQGQDLWTSLLNSGALLCSEVHLTADGQPAPNLPRLDRGQTGLDPGYRLYQTQDGWIQVAAVTETAWRALCSAVGLSRLGEDGRYATASGRSRHRGELEVLLQEAFRSRTARAWSVLLDAAGVPSEPAVDTLEGSLVLHDDDNVRLGLCASYDHPRLGRITQFGDLIRFGDTPAGTHTRPPLLGEHTREIMERLGYDPATVDAYRARGIVYEPDDGYPWPN